MIIEAWITVERRRPTGSCSRKGFGRPGQISDVRGEILLPGKETKRCQFGVYRLEKMFSSCRKMFKANKGGHDIQ